MRMLRMRPGWELSRSGALAGTWSGGPVPVTRARAARRAELRKGPVTDLVRCGR